MKLVTLIILVVLQLSACAEKPSQLEVVNGRTMGTSYSIKWPIQTIAFSPADVQLQVDEVLSIIVSQMSTYDASSELSLFNRSPSPHSQDISPEFAEVMALSLKLNDLTNGFFDVSVGPLVNLWGFGPDKFPSVIPTSAQISEAMSQTGLNGLKLQGTVLSKVNQRYIDLSAVAKGYAVDEVARLLEKIGIDNYLVEIGGEMYAKGEKGSGLLWNIAIEAPDLVARQVHKVLPVKDVAIATSGDYRNYFEIEATRYSHSINPKTGRPVEHTLASVTIIDDKCAKADALATAMLVMGIEKAKDFALINEVKAYMIVRNEQGKFEEFLTPAFTRWFNP